jgi:signal transduction histidine kinase
VTRRLLASYVLLAAFILLLVELPLGLTYAGRAEDRFLAEVERDARVLAAVVEEQAEDGRDEQVLSTAQRYASQTDGRVVITDADGRSVVDTAGTGTTGRDFSSRPEFTSALAGSQAAGLRESDTLGEELAFVAVPIYSGDRVAGALRISFPTDDLQAQVRENWFRLAGLSALVLLTAAAVGWFIARWATAPVASLEQGARRLAAGDLTARTEVDRGPPELRQLAATFNDMAARVEVLVDSQRAFVADASHQLRTPLTALRLRIESLEERTAHDPASARDVEAIADEVQRLGLLVEGLLAVARSEARTAVVTIDVAASAKDATQRWEALAAEHGVRLVLDAAQHTPARFVEGGLDQVLDNLLDNAIEASPSGTAIDVTVELDDHDRAVVLTVRDHGAGLDADQRARATDRFWRGGDASPGGTGLGLSICAELVRASAGTFQLDAPADGTSGLVATVRLPRGQ